MSDDYDYNRANVIDEMQGLAEVRLSGPATLELTQWADGDFRVVVYHTIDATYPFDAEANGEEHGEPFYRERLRFSTTGDEEGWTRHEVVRRRCGETGWSVVWSERVGGYTPNWPAPITDDDEDDQRDGPRIPYQGRFA
jgi:hypothetical protein